MPSKRPQRIERAGAVREAPDARLRERRTARRHGEDRERGVACGGGVECARQHVGAHHHARTAAGRRVVDRAVPVGGKVADLYRIERPLALGERAAGEAGTERPGKHLGIEREDGGGEAHCRLAPIAVPRRTPGPRTEKGGAWGSGPRRAPGNKKGMLIAGESSARSGSPTPPRPATARHRRPPSAGRCRSRPRPNSADAAVASRRGSR